MDAEGRSLDFLVEEEPLSIPFFQRPYVWTEENWNDLLNDLLRTKGSHFIGSLIIKRIPKSGKTPAHGVIIDGQQRLTTLSILVKVMYEILYSKNKLESKSAELAKNCLFTYKSSKYQIRITHSHLDKDKFDAIIGDVKTDRKDKSVSYLTSPMRDDVLKELAEEEKINKQLIAEKKKEIPFTVDRQNLMRSCYKYFYFRLMKEKISVVKKLLETLFEKSNKILVLIDIHSEEQEQEIFDTINSAGMALTSTDIIKNALYEKLRKYLSEADVLDHYKQNWEEVFENEDSDRLFWTEELNVGRYKRDNSELLFQAIAIIEGIYDVRENTLSDLSKTYKSYIEKLSNEKEIKDFIKKIMDYAKIYKELPRFSNSHFYKWNNVQERLSCIMGASENTTFMPYVLYLYYNFNDDEDTLLKRLTMLERILMHYIISGASNKNFNKYCTDMIHNDKKGETALLNYIKGVTLEDEKEGLDTFSEDELRKGLKEKSNLAAKIILFWVELHRNSSNEKSDKNYSGNCFAKELELEHILPQKWDKKAEWKSVAIVDENGNSISDDPENYRKQKIYSIGNMTLLPKKLNTSISNSNFEIKINGKDGKNKKHTDGIKDCSTYSITTEIFPGGSYTNDDYLWNEQIISKREKSLADEIISIWPVL